MDNILEKLESSIRLMGFGEIKITADEEHRRILILIDDEAIKRHTPIFLESLEHIFNLIFRKHQLPPYVIDLNYYRRERERLIADLARAAAHKAMLTKSEIELPPMNAYERRLVHLEITSNPELKTESVGIGRSRRIVIKHLE